MSGLFSIVWVIFIVVALVNSSMKKNQKKQSAVPPLTAQPINTNAGPVTQQPLQPMAAQPPKPVPTVAAPRVHTHLAPDCDKDDPSGSMEFTSTEGIDPCHDDDLPNRQTPRPAVPAAQEKPGLTLDWTGDALVKSVVMQEILTRPCQRQRR